MAATRLSIARRPRRDAGFGLIEVLLSTVILVVAVMGNVGSVTSAHSVTKAVGERSRALEVLALLLERLRGDDDWIGLYARLAVRSRESTYDTYLSSLGVDARLTTYPATAYYSDITVPSELGNLSFLIQVPCAPGATLPTLRESQVAPRYGLPADLNGDGTIATDSRANDYRALPVVVRMRWKRPNGATEEIVLPTWLRGER